MTRLPLSVPLGSRMRDDARSAQDVLVQRIRMVLETRPGTIPWRPEFGCDLASLVGEPLTPQRIAEVRWRISEALQRWVQDVQVRDVRVHLTTDLGAEPLRDRRLPIAEAALVRFGVQGALDLEVDLDGDLGPLMVSARIQG